MLVDPAIIMQLILELLCQEVVKSPAEEVWTLMIELHAAHCDVLPAKINSDVQRPGRRVRASSILRPKPAVWWVLMEAPVTLMETTASSSSWKDEALRCKNGCSSQSFCGP